MLTTIILASALCTHNVFALSIGNRGAQVVLSGNIIPASPWEDVDISEGWADPRINGGRFLDVSLSPVNPMSAGRC